METNISSRRYVEITSGQGGAAAFGDVELKLRLYTTNELAPTHSVLNFTSLAAVGTHFGTTSIEYLQAQYYFGYTSKTIFRPKSIQFARWANADTSAQVFGSQSANLTTLQAITAGAFNVNLGGTTLNITGLDFSADTTFAEVAAALQVQIRAAGGGLAAATVTYDSGRQGFNFDTEGTADGEISFTEVTTGLLNSLGWGSAAIFSDGIATQTIADVLGRATNVNNNYGTFAFIPTLTLEQHTDAANWNKTEGAGDFRYLLRVLRADAATWSAALIGIGGTELIEYDVATNYTWLLSGAQTASQEYNRPAASSNYMFLRDSRLNATVFSDTDATTLDNARVNYIGRTQQSGSNVSFYQRGVLTGGSTDILDTGAYTNEQWLRGFLKVEFLNRMLALPQIVADEDGEAIGYQIVDYAIDRGLFNGTISVGKTLTETEKSFVSQVSGDPLAYHEVQNNGAWRTVSITREVNNGVTEFVLQYTLIYAKADSVKKVEGRHILI